MTGVAASKLEHDRPSTPNQRKRVKKIIALPCSNFLESTVIHGIPNSDTGPFAPGSLAKVGTATDSNRGPPMKHHESLDRTALAFKGSR